MFIISRMRSAPYHLWNSAARVLLINIADECGVCSCRLFAQVGRYGTYVGNTIYPITVDPNHRISHIMNFPHHQIFPLTEYPHNIKSHLAKGPTVHHQHMDRVRPPRSILLREIPFSVMWDNKFCEIGNRFRGSWALGIICWVISVGLQGYCVLGCRLVVVLPNVYRTYLTRYGR